jgi:hypothetical protein
LGKRVASRRLSHGERNAGDSTFDSRGSGRRRRGQGRRETRLALMNVMPPLWGAVPPVWLRGRRLGPDPHPDPLAEREGIIAPPAAEWRNKSAQFLHICHRESRHILVSPDPPYNRNNRSGLSDTYSRFAQLTARGRGSYWVEADCTARGAADFCGRRRRAGHVGLTSQTKQDRGEIQCHPVPISVIQCHFVTHPGRGLRRGTLDGSCCCAARERPVLARDNDQAGDHGKFGQI